MAGTHSCTVVRVGPPGEAKRRAFFMQLKAGMLQSEAADNGMMQPGGAVTQPPLCDGRRLTAVDRTRAHESGEAGSEAHRPL